MLHTILLESDAENNEKSTMNELKPIIYDEISRLDYILVRDNYIPAIELAKDGYCPIEKWMHLKPTTNKPTEKTSRRKLALEGFCIFYIFEIRRFSDVPLVFYPQCGYVSTECRYACSGYSDRKCWGQWEEFCQRYRGASAYSRCERSCEWPY